ncbi:hypothetical protein Pla52o_29540 [Novipirellula galeiformis]|uniref:Uncharacterized protein n=1 Tax=Novipirellula galeiformis TaxID=2528004 RepID=A0A5C6CGH5_9BACT|nr:hypothetical protein Pla52o_29540 [Novipirellula galeiformis]
MVFLIDKISSALMRRYWDVIGSTTGPHPVQSLKLSFFQIISSVHGRFPSPTVSR